MHLLEDIYEELSSLGLTDTGAIQLAEIRNKDGIHLYRVTCADKSYVLKYFMKDEYKREIKNYAILSSLQIPTIKVYGSTDKALLLEDLDRSSRYRLATAADLSDAAVAKVLADWYIQLHEKGAEYLAKHSSSFYRETDSITIENIHRIREKSNTLHNPVWDLLIDNLDPIFCKLKAQGETLTYNDFYWTNLVVSRDKSEAFMFDYNLLGAGFRYNDLRNVCSSLSEEAGREFLEAYGGYNQAERIIDEGISILINLIFAYQLPSFPRWAQESLDAVHSGRLFEAISKIVQLPHGEEC